jgi:hypothetical protein
MSVMVSFRAEAEDVRRADRLAARLGIERSELLRDALANHLARLSADEEAEAYERQPLTDDERALHGAQYAGAAEDWTDWVEWLDRRDREAS